MIIETILPLGTVDRGLRAAEQPFDNANSGHGAALFESLGYDRLVF